MKANNLPLFRGNKSVVEVASVDTNPTKLPDMGTLQSGTMDTSTRCFDLLCFGKCVSENDLKLNIQSTGEPPNLITKNANGDIVFAEPTPMCTIQAPAGHNVWVNIELKTVTTKASDYMCLGIKKRGEEDYYDVLHSENLSRYVDAQEGDIVELVPLISSTKLPTYTAVKAGDSAKITDESSYDFGSVYRVNITLNSERWIMNQPNDLFNIRSKPEWNNDGRVAIGTVANKKGKLINNQLVIVNRNGQLAYSPDGIYWTELGNVIKGNESLDQANDWHYHAEYGNGIWCIGNSSASKGIRRSVDYGESWSDTVKSIDSRNLAFHDGLFLTITPNGIVYSSPDAEIWTQIGTTVSEGDSGRLLIYKNNRWIYGTVRGHIYYSKDGKGKWEHLSDELYNIGNGASVWRGFCYANGYFYAVHESMLTVLRSSDGEHWEKVTLSFPSTSTVFRNITCYKNKLYLFAGTENFFHVGLFRPDGTI